MTHELGLGIPSFKFQPTVVKTVTKLLDVPQTLNLSVGEPVTINELQQHDFTLASELHPINEKHYWANCECSIIKDDNGNTTTKSISFKVENKTEPKTVKDNVVGIVLIVVSVVLLGGVILFFALAGKRNKTNENIALNNNESDITKKELFSKSLAYDGGLGIP